jgi:hypothetical protein
MRHYAVLVAILSLAAVHDWRWLWLVPLLFGARAVRNIWTRAGQKRWRALLNPAVVLGVMALTIVIDAATFAGWRDARAGGGAPGRQPAAG